MNLPSPIIEPFNNRILIIDDNPAIHDDFRKVLGTADHARLKAIEEDEAALFGHEIRVPRHIEFDIHSAFQGAEGLEKVREAAAAGQPFAMAFVDVRMPPGWDGIETILHIWKEFPHLQMVICTAYSDYSWDQIAEAVGVTDSILILKKPFDSVEALQIAHTLTRKWQLSQAARRQMAELDRLVHERTAELRLTNEELHRQVVERTAAEEALRNSEERFSKAFRSSPLAMSIQHLGTGVSVDHNHSYEELAGYPRAEAVAINGAAVPFWVNAHAPEEIRRDLARGATVRARPAEVRTRSGAIRSVLVSAEQFSLANEPHLLLIFEDITERAQLEEQLRQSHKMEAVGQLAAGIAHDFNNLLTVILGNASIQLSKDPADECLASSLRHIIQASERAGLLTGQLLAYSRKQIIRRQSLDLNEGVEENLALLRRLIGEHISIEAELTPSLPAIHADATSVNQIVMNLAINARDAMPNGGELSLRTHVKNAGEALVAHYPGVRAGPFVCLTVQDSGCGMDAETLGRIFEPFFTTKEQGKGTGMGLATVYGIAQQHNGWVEVESEPGNGTTFRVYFPLGDESATLDPLRSPELLPSRASKQIVILIAEDEPMLREFVQTALESLGYCVLSAADGREALAIWEKVNGEVDLLLTDLVMPGGVSGWQLARRLTAAKPDLKVIFTSGYSAELMTQEFEDCPEHQFLAKPFLTEKLARTVAIALGQESPPLPDLVSHD